MEKKQKRSLSEYLVVIILVLLFCFGGFMFTIAVGLDSVAKMLLLIAAVMSILSLLIKFLPNAVMPLFYVASCTATLYAFGGLRLINYIIGIPLIILSYWGFYKLGDHFGWWKPASWNK